MPNKSISIEITRFFGGSTTSSHTLNEPKFDSEITLLSGPPQSGKSSLLFQYGYSYAREGKNVLLIVDKKKFTQSLPLFPEIVVSTNKKQQEEEEEEEKQEKDKLEEKQDGDNVMLQDNGDKNTTTDSLDVDHDHDINIHSGSERTFIDRDNNILKRIKIKYIQDDHELRSYLMEFPTLNILPDLILIDDISLYFGPSIYERTNILAKIFAFLKETIHYINSQKMLIGKEGSCKSIVTDYTTYQPPVQPVHINNNNNDPLIQPSVQAHQPSYQATTQQQQQQQQLSTAHPKFLFAIQRWANLVLIINEISSTTTNVQGNNNNIEKQLSLSIFKCKESMKEYNVDYKIYVSNKTYKIDAINFNKKVEQD